MKGWVSGLFSSMAGGFLERVGCERIDGWAWDQQQRNTPMAVEIYDGETLLVTVTANRMRSDLVEARKGNGRHAFVVKTPPSSKDGVTHQIHAKIADRGIELEKSPQALECPDARWRYSPRQFVACRTARRAAAGPMQARRSAPDNSASARLGGCISRANRAMAHLQLRSVSGGVRRALEFADLGNQGGTPRPAEIADADHPARRGHSRWSAARVDDGSPLPVVTVPVRGCLESLTVSAWTQFESLVSAKLYVKHNDLRIAAIAKEIGATVVTRNRRDFGRVPGLIIEDWAPRCPHRHTLADDRQARQSNGRRSPGCGPTY